MTWETFPCCCNSPSCLCGNLYTTMIAKWTGSVTFRPLQCKEYWKKWVSNPLSLCGSTARLVLPQTTTFSIPSIAVPGLTGSGTLCFSRACVQRQSQVNRYFASFEPFPGSPEYFDPEFRCLYDQLDTVYGPYQLAFNHSIVVYGPGASTPFFPASPKWRAKLSIGSVDLWWISTGPDFSCLPQDFVLDPSMQYFDVNVCHSPCNQDGCPFGTQDFSCVIVNPPPPPFSFPGGGGAAGSPFAHEVEIDPGVLRIY